MRSKLLQIYGSADTSQPSGHVIALCNNEDSILSTWSSSNFYAKNDDLEGSIGLKWATIKDLERLNVFNTDLIDYLRGLPECVYSHQEVGLHIRYFIEEGFQMDPGSFQIVDADKLKDDLSYLAFTDEVAEIATERIEESVLCGQDAMHWAVSVFESLIIDDTGERSQYDAYDGLCMWNMLGLGLYYLDNDVLWDQGDYKYYNGNQVDGPVVNKFIDFTIGTVRNASTRSIRIINISISTPTFDESCFNNEEGMTYLFHGTDWSRAEHIVKNGIRLQDGANDFSCSGHPGFYVSHCFRHASAFIDKFKEPAVIVFQVPTSTFNRPEHKDVTGLDRNYLTKIHTHFRSDGDEEVQIKEELRGIRTIHGYILKNPLTFMESGISLDRDITQTCILSTDTARELYNRIHCIAYYRRNTRPRTRQRRS